MTKHTIDSFIKIELNEYGELKAVPEPVTNENNFVSLTIRGDLQITYND